MSNCNGSLRGRLDVGAGERGKSLEFEWRGTELGVRVEGQEEYQFTDLGIEGAKGENGKVHMSYGLKMEMKEH